MGRRSLLVLIMCAKGEKILRGRIWQYTSCKRAVGEVDGTSNCEYLHRSTDQAVGPTLARETMRTKILYPMIGSIFGAV